MKKVAQKSDSASEMLISPKDFFSDLLRLGLIHRKVETYPHVIQYLTSLLQYYVDARNLYSSQYDESGRRQPQTLAEMLLVASNSEAQVRTELLKRLGDKSLYISGFFSDSLNFKVVDVDYYRDMGVTAYSTLAGLTNDELTAKVYGEIADRFIDFMDVLTFISQRFFVTTNSSILRLYERYLRTGSELAKERLHELGVLTSAAPLAKQD